MQHRTLSMKLTAIVAIVALGALGLPAGAAGVGASRVAGAILSGPEETPLAGARLHLGDPRSGRIWSSAPTATDGSFELAEVPPATYEVAVEADGGLYVVATPLQVSPGESPNLQVAVSPLAPGQMAPPPQEADKEKNKGGTSVWNNPATAALIVVGSAVVIGLLIKEATDDDDDEQASPS